MKNRNKKEKAAEKEIRRSVLLNQEDKKYWLESLKALPDAILKDLHKYVFQKNKIVDKYIHAALAKDKKRKYLPEFKSKMRSIIRKAFALEEKSEKGDTDSLLKKQIENL